MKANDTIFVLMTAAALLVAAPSAFADVQPETTPTATRQSIQAAIDAAAAQSPAGTVTLSAGTFEIDAQLMVTNGVTLQGQGWDSTIIRQTATDRVATLAGGARLQGVTATGGRLTAGWTHGPGLLVEDGTVSWCRIVDNISTGRNVHGGGVNITKGTVDHCIVAFNQAGTYTSSGGGIGTYNTSGTFVIDTCLVHDNTTSVTDSAGKGGGICVNMGNPTVTIRNTTIAGNSSSGSGGGFYNGSYGNKVKLVNTLVAGNSSDSEADSHDGTLASGSSNNLLGVDPSFVDPSNGDFHLAFGAPAINAGATYTGIDRDLDNVTFANPPAVGCYEYGERAAEPAFDPAPGSTFYPTASVTLSCATPAASIYYTTDGSVPTDSSTPYMAPITLSATTTIRARAYATGKGPSGIVSATYTFKRPVPKPSAFKKSVEITLATDALAGVATGVPALVRLDESAIDGFDYGDFSLPNGGDLMFFDANGTPLPHEVDTWDETGESLVWVKLASTVENTKIVMCYGNGTVSSEEPEDVWTDYVGVWHFEEATAATTAYSYGTYANSTATTGIDGNIAQYTVTNEVGRIGKGFRVNDSTGKGLGNFNYGGVWVNDSGTGSPVDGGKNFTISGWFKHGAFQYSWDHIFYKRQKSNNTGSPTGAFAIECNSTTDPPNPLPRGSSGSGNAKTLSNNLDGTWGYLTFVFDGATCHVYENGMSVGDSSITACSDNDTPLVFGNNCDIASGSAGDSAWNGWIDEVRYSNGSKSAAWVAAEYAAMNVSATDIFAYGAATSTQSAGAVISVR